MLLAYFNSSLRAMGEGLLFAAGVSAWMKGLLPAVDMGVAVAMPKLVQFMETFTRMKMALDPNNVACRRWEYEDECAKKFIILF